MDISKAEQLIKSSCLHSFLDGSIFDCFFFFFFFFKLSVFSEILAYANAAPSIHTLLSRLGL